MMEFSYAQVIASHAAESPEAPAITFGESTLTFADLDRRGSQLAKALLAAGVRHGDRVAVLSKNHPVFFELSVACSKIGAVLVGLNWRLAPSEIEAIVTDASPVVVIVADEQRTLLGDGTTCRVIGLETEYESWIGQAAEVSTVGPSITSSDDVILLLYTSGTTGVPKGVELTHRNVSYTERLAREVWRFTADSVNLVGMPMFHIGGIGYGMGCVIVGGHTVLIRDSDPLTIIGAIVKHRVTHAFFVPAVIQTILAAPEVEAADLSSLELVVYGASPIGDAVLRRAISVLGCSFMQNYGMTETAGSVVALLPADHQPDDPARSALLRSCGRPVDWIELGLFDPSTGQQVPTGSVGEIWVRTKMVMRGYRNKPEETAKTVTSEGWLRTGDAAYADENGYVFLFDRYKDMIVSGAENIYPAEIENVLYDHPSIAEVAVIGVPSERWGETPRAIVVRRPGTEHEALTGEAVIEFARTRLARYKCPSSVDFVDVLPRNASGKVLKKELRAPFWVGHDRSIS
jgi:acyl-CoA synthetase (AMP-forming)/AMP-acid ligase II